MEDLVSKNTALLRLFCRLIRCEESVDWLEGYTKVKKSVGQGEQQDTNTNKLISVRTVFHAAAVTDTEGRQCSDPTVRADSVARDIVHHKFLMKNARLLLEESDEDVVDQPQSTY